MEQNNEFLALNGSQCHRTSLRDLNYRSATKLSGGIMKTRTHISIECFQNILKSMPRIGADLKAKRCC